MQTATLRKRGMQKRSERLLIKRRTPFDRARQDKISVRDMRVGSNVCIKNVLPDNPIMDQPMLRTLARRAVLALVLVFAYGHPANAGQLFQVESPTPGGPVDATADFTLGHGTLEIVLTDLLQNPTSDAQLVSGVTFTVSGATGSGLLTSASGLDSSVNTKLGTYTAGAASTLPHWSLLSTSDLTTLSGKKPNELIIGPDDHGGFNPALGKYTHANSSISQHNPVVLGVGTFDLSIPGITGSSIISDVSIQFGTTGYSVGAIAAVPEPSSLALCALPIVLLGLAALQRRLA
jgi:hypothetical protein